MANIQKLLSKILTIIFALVIYRIYLNDILDEGSYLNLFKLETYDSVHELIGFIIVTIFEIVFVILVCSGVFQKWIKK